MAVPAECRQLLRALPEPAVLVTRGPPTGVVLAFNDAAGALFLGAGGGLVGRPLTEVMEAPAEAVARFLKHARTVFEPVPASFTPVGAARPFRFEACCVRAGMGGPSGLLLVRGRPQGEAVAAFTILNERISALTAEVKRRRDAEAALNDYRDRLEEMVHDRTAALEQAQVRLQNSERMAVIGTFAAGIGHDMGNLLMPVAMNVDVLESAVEERGAPPGGPGADEVRKVCGAIRQCVDQLQRLAVGLRQLAMDPAQESVLIQDVDLHEWSREVHTLLAATLPRHVDLLVQVPAGLPRARIARHLLTQSVFNLVQNAGDATRDQERGRVTVTAHYDAGAGTLVLSVRDDGPGMSEEVRRRCMDPFFTTKTRVLSTGLGLSLARSAAASVGGNLSVVSAPGQGATFLLTIPVVVEGGASSDAGPGVLVTLPIGRRHAYVASLLRAMGLRADAGERPNGHGIWIGAAESMPDGTLREFLDADPARGAIVLDLHGEDLPNPHPRVIAIPAGAGLSAVRGAITETVRRAQGQAVLRA